MSNSCTNSVWVTMYFVVLLQISTSCFSNNSVASLLNSDPLSHWNTSWYLKTPPFSYIASNTNPTLLAFLLGLKVSWCLVSRCNINTCLYLFAHVAFKDITKHINQIKLLPLIRFCHIVMKVNFLWVRYMNLPNPRFVNHGLINFLGIDVILCSSLIALRPFWRWSD